MGEYVQPIPAHFVLFIDPFHKVTCEMFKDITKYQQLCNNDPFHSMHKCFAGFPTKYMIVDLRFFFLAKICKKK